MDERTLIIYDTTGTVISAQRGTALREPVGVPFLWVEIPENKQISFASGVDVSVTPHQVILEDIPPSEMEKLRLEMARSNAEMFEMIVNMAMGGEM